MSRVLVCGGRNFTDRGLMWGTLAQFNITELCHGGAKGADTQAGDWARLCGVPTTVFPADWKQHGRAAGAIRNRLMLEEFKPQYVIAFPGGVGTADMVAISLKSPYVKQVIFVDEWGAYSTAPEQLTIMEWP